MKDDISLKRFNCDSPCNSVNKCGHLPLELHRFNKKKGLDILLLTEFPGKSEIEGKKFFDNKARHGAPVRSIIKLIEKKYGCDWSYGICGLFKAQSVKSSIDIRDLNHCIKQVLTREIKYSNPKVILCFGEYAYNFIFNKQPPFGILLEDGKLYENVQICGEKRDIFCSIHPSWHVSQSDGCSLGPLYEVIRRTVDYVVNGTNLNIPNKFKTELLTDYDDVKNVLKKMRTTPEIIGVDTEDNNLNRVYNNDILSLQLSCDGKLGYVIPINHYESPFKDNAKLKKLLYSFFTKTNPKTKGYVFVNAKFDMHQLFNRFSVIEYNAPLLDCSFAEFSLEENWTRLHGFPKEKGYFSLFTMAYRRGFTYYAESEAKEMRANLSHLPLSKWTKYGGADVVAPWQIFKSQELQATQTEYRDNFDKLNKVFFGHLIRSTMYVEHCGLSIDAKILEFLHSHKGPFDEAYNDIMNEFFSCDSVKNVNNRLAKESIGTSAVGLFGTARVFNPSRPGHREELYFNELQLEPVEDDEEDTGTTGKAFQKQYKDAYKEVKLLEDFNTITKMKTGFVDPVYDWIRSNSANRRDDIYMDKRVRGTFTYMAVTGRLRCYKPNCFTLDTKVVIEGKETCFYDILKTYNKRRKQQIDLRLRIKTGTGERYTKKLFFYRNQKVLDINKGLLKCTLNNKLYIYRGDKFTLIEAQELRIGDWLITTEPSKDFLAFMTRRIEIKDTNNKDVYYYLKLVTSIKEIDNVDVADFEVEHDYSPNIHPLLHRGNLIVNNLLSSNSQQRPSRGKHTKTILSMYSPKKGRAVLKLDYVTFEVKGLGFMSEDKAMVKSFNEMHKLKLQYRKDPKVFFQQGYEVEKKSLLKKKKELLDQKQKLASLKRISRKDYEESKRVLKENIEQFNKEKENLKELAKNNPEKFSHDYLVFLTDFHRRSAALFNKCAIELVSKEMRQNAKGLVFGCATGDTIVSTETGPYRIKELVKQPTNVVSLMGRIRESDGAVSKGVKPVVSVLTRQGNLKFTSGHKIPVVTKKFKIEMKCIGELKKGDCVIYQKGKLGNEIPKLSGKNISINDAESMGLFTGDGSANIYDKNVRRIPNQILRSREEYLCAYLRGYFDADGGIRFSSKKRSQIFLSSMNVDLLTDVCYALSLLNVTSHIYKRKENDYELIITSANSMLVFYEKIGFGTKKKNKRLQEWIKKIQKIERKLAEDKCNYPFSIKDIRKKYTKKAGVNNFRAKKVYYNDVYIPPLTNLFEDPFAYKEAFYALGMKKEWKCIRLLCCSNVKLSLVVEEAKPCGEEEVYDVINVKQYHKWCANGVVVSNSIYGRSVESIAKELKIELSVAQEYFDLFMSNMPQAGEWLEKKKEQGKMYLCVESPLGRRRRLWGYIYDNKTIHNKMDRLAMNTIIQGICSDCNLVATSLLISFIQRHNKLKYQCSDKECWMLTNLIHDSCEMEVPIVDVYYTMKSFESLYTNLLMHYIEKAFGFKIKVPLEVDFTVGSTYAETQDWDGSDEHARYLQKWIIEACSKRDKVDYSDLYDKAINNKMFKTYKGMDKEVVEDWIKLAKTF